MIAAPRKSGFSLLELLVAIAILSVLVALGISALGKSREHAAAVRCVSHLRQLGAAFSQCAGENRGVIKFQQYDARRNPSTVRWSDFMIQGGYLSATSNALRCPGTSADLPVGTGYVYGGVATASPNDPYSRTIDNIAASRAIHLLTIAEPSKYWLLVDTWSTQHNNQIYVVDPLASSRWRAQTRHSKRANFLFADGHIEALGIEAMREFAINPLINAYNAQGHPLQ